MKYPAAAPEKALLDADSMALLNTFYHRDFAMFGYA